MPLLVTVSVVLLRLGLVVVVVAVVVDFPLLLQLKWCRSFWMMLPQCHGMPDVTTLFDAPKGRLKQWPSSCRAGRNGGVVISNSIALSHPVWCGVRAVVLATLVGAIALKVPAAGAATLLALLSWSSWAR